MLNKNFKSPFERAQNDWSVWSTHSLGRHHRQEVKWELGNWVIVNRPRRMGTRTDGTQEPKMQTSPKAECPTTHCLWAQGLRGSGAQGCRSKLKDASSVSSSPSLKETLQNLWRNLKGHLICSLLLMLHKYGARFVIHWTNGCFGVVLNDWQTLGAFRPGSEPEKAAVGSGSLPGTQTRPEP